MFDYSSCVCDSRTQLEQAQANLWFTLQTQQILMAAPTTCVQPPAWVHAARVYPTANQCRCDDYSSFRQRRTNCKNCGAPTGIDGHCHYCGTYN